MVKMSAKTIPGKLVEFLILPIMIPSAFMVNVFPIIGGPIKFGFDTVISPIFEATIRVVDMSVLTITNPATLCFDDVA